MRSVQVKKSQRVKTMAGRSNQFFSLVQTGVLLLSFLLIGSQSLVYADTDFLLKEDPGKGGFSVINSKMDFKPTDWLTLVSKLEFILFHAEPFQ